MYHLKNIINDTSILSKYKSRDSIPIICDYCLSITNSHQKKKIQTKIKNRKIFLYCSISCSHKHRFELGLKIINGVKHKECYDCNNLLPLNSFPKSGKDGHQCSLCRSRKYKHSVKKYQSTKRGILSRYKSSAKRREIDFTLTEAEFFDLISLPCFYCGEDNSSGVDRIDSSKEYATYNCKPCCKLCNQMKMDSDFNSFISRCKLIASKH